VGGIPFHQTAMIFYNILNFLSRGVVMEKCLNCDEDTLEIVFSREGQLKNGI